MRAGLFILLVYIRVGRMKLTFGAMLRPWQKL